MNRHVGSVRRHSCIVLRHLCYVGRHVSVQCDETPALCYGTSVTWAGTSLFSTVPYLRVNILLRPSYSLLLVYTSKHLYDKNLNNEQ